MRKLLLASAAMLGATAGIVSAQAQSSSTMQPAVNGPQALQGQISGPWWTGNSYNNQNNATANIGTYRGNVIGWGADSPPQPGQVQIHLHGRVEVDGAAIFSSTNNIPGGVPISTSSITGLTAAANIAAVNAANAAVTAINKANGSHIALATVPTAPTTAGAKLNPVNMGAYMRLYPGMDGLATNGLRYGAQMEIREAFSGLSPNPYVSQNGITPATNKTSQSLYVNRAYIYMAADNVGLLRLGQADGVVGLFDPCIFSGQCWDAGIGVFQGVLAGVGNANEQIPFFPTAQNSSDYSNVKAVYISPQLYGFELGLQFAPNQGNSFADCSGNVAPLSASTAAIGTPSGCNNTVTGTDPTRWYNQVGVGVRYQNIWGPAALGLYGFWGHAGMEHPYGTPIPAAKGAISGTNGAYENINWWQFAGYGRYNTGFGVITVSMDYAGGQTNPTWVAVPTGGINMVGLMPGIMYQQGPFTMGVSGNWLTSQGAAALTGISQRQENALALGGNYAIAPGLFVVGEYQYTLRHQGGYDFSIGAAGINPTTGKQDGSGLTRNANSNAYLVAFVVTW